MIAHVVRQLINLYVKFSKFDVVVLVQSRSQTAHRRKRRPGNFTRFSWHCEHDLGGSNQIAGFRLSCKCHVTNAKFKLTAARVASYPGSLRGAGERAWYALFAHVRN